MVGRVQKDLAPLVCTGIVMLSDGICQNSFRKTNPWGQVLIFRFPFPIVGQVHPEHDAITLVIGYIDTEAGIWCAGKFGEVEFPLALACLYDFRKIHTHLSHWCSKELAMAPCLLLVKYWCF